MSLRLSELEVDKLYFHVADIVTNKKAASDSLELLQKELVKETNNIISQETFEKYRDDLLEDINKLGYKKLKKHIVIGNRFKMQVVVENCDGIFKGFLPATNPYVELKKFNDYYNTDYRLMKEDRRK